MKRVVFLVSLLFIGCGSSDNSNKTDKLTLDVNTTWQWQLQGAINTSYDVKVYDIEEGIEVCYKIVDFIDSNPNEFKISYNSPLAKALLGKEEGDEFIAKLPGGEKEFEVLEIYYED